MIHKPFNQQITQDDINLLVENETKEGRTLEYKQQLPGITDEDKKEFLADVSSFANAAGGDLLYGVKEKRDADNKATGFPECVPGLAGINTDQEICRIDSMIQASVAPRITGIHIQPVDGFEDGPLLLLRIPKSYAAPHMVTFKNHSRFYSRNNGGKYALDVGELRSAFALSESLPERIRRFRDERLARIIAGETPLQLRDGSKVVLHIMPLSAIVSKEKEALDIHRLCDQHGGLPLPCFASAGRHCRFNFDGLLSFDTGSESDTRIAYAQAFRNGAAEFVDTCTLAGIVQQQVLPVTRIEKSLIRGLTEYMRIMASLDVQPPLVVMPSLLGVRGSHINYQADCGPYPIDRNDLFLSDVLVEDMRSNAAQLLRPTFDALWQAAGWRRSFNYNEQGEWVER